MSRTLRPLRWLPLALFLIVVGLWPAAAAPISLAATGAAVIITAIPAPVLAAVAVIAWLKHRHTPKPATA
jgi:hypothetical protein